MATSHNNLIESLIQQLGAPDPEQRWAAFVRLTQRYSDYTDRYLAALQDPNPQVRRGAVQLLSHHGDATTRKVVLSHLDDPDPTVRIAVANTFSYYSYPLQVTEDWTAADLLIRLLRDPAPEVRCYAAQHLMADGLHEAVPPLIALLEDSAVEVREAAILALGTINDPQAIPALRQFIETDRGVTSEGLHLNEIALTALTWIGQPLLSWEDLAQQADPGQDDTILPTDLLPDAFRLTWGMDLPECLACLKAKPMYIGFGYLSIPLYLAGQLRGVSFLFENPDDYEFRYDAVGNLCDPWGNCYDPKGQRISGDARRRLPGLRSITHTLANEHSRPTRQFPGAKCEQLYERLIAKYGDVLAPPTFSGSRVMKVDPNPATAGDPTSPTYYRRNFDYPAWDSATWLTYWNQPEGCVKIGLYHEDDQYSVELASQRTM